MGDVIEIGFSSGRARSKTFRASDWRYLYTAAAGFVGDIGLTDLSAWLDRQSGLERPRKRDQDVLDACLCLAVAAHLALSRDALVVGDHESGYIVVPHTAALEAELARRCERTQRIPQEWVRRFRLFAEG